MEFPFSTDTALVHLFLRHHSGTCTWRDAVHVRDCMPTQVHPSCRGSNYDDSFNLISSGQLQFGCSFNGMLPFHLCSFFFVYVMLEFVTNPSVIQGLLLFQGFLDYLLCLVSLRDTSGHYGHLTILLWTHLFFGASFLRSLALVCGKQTSMLDCLVLLLNADHLLTDTKTSDCPLYFISSLTY